MTRKLIKQVYNKITHIDKVRNIIHTSERLIPSKQETSIILFIATQGPLKVNSCRKINNLSTLNKNINAFCCTKLGIFLQTCLLINHETTANPVCGRSKFTDSRKLSACILEA